MSSTAPPAHLTNHMSTFSKDKMAKRRRAEEEKADALIADFWTQILGAVPGQPPADGYAFQANFGQLARDLDVVRLRLAGALAAFE